MGDYVFKLPDIGEGVVEGEIVSWHVKVGDTIVEDAPIVDVMTDKATVTIPSPTSGTVKELSGEVGDMIAVGTALITFSGSGDEVSSTEEHTETIPVPEPVIEEAVELEEKVVEVVEKKSTPEKVLIQEPIKTTKMRQNTRVLASPAVRRRAREAELDLTFVSGSGPAGRIRHADLDAYIAAGGAVTGAPPKSYSTKRTETNEICLLYTSPSPRDA